MNPVSSLKKLPLFQSLSDGEIDSIVSGETILNLDRGEILFHAGVPAEHVYVVLFGSIKLTRSHPEGKNRIVHLLLSGEIFGAAIALRGGAYPLTATALESSRVIRFKKETFQKLMNHPRLGNELLNQISHRMSQAHEDQVAVFDTTEKRIAGFLLELLERIQEKSGSTSRISVPLTRQDIADRVGSTVETVIRILSQWGKKNLITTYDRHIEIPNPLALTQEVGL